MKEIAKVVSVNGRIAKVVCQKSEACETCGGSGFCSVNARDFSALNNEGFDLKPGQTVELFLPPGRTIWTGFVVLVFPLVLFLLFFLLGRDLLGLAKEGVNALLGLAGLALGFGISMLLTRKNREKSMPKIVKVLGEE